MHNFRIDGLGFKPIILAKYALLGFRTCQPNAPIVVIVGAGACGALVAKELAAQGFSVVNLWAALCLHFAHCNFCRVHKRLR